MKELPSPLPAGHLGDDFIRGVAVGLHFDLPGLPYQLLFKEIRGLGATHVSLVVIWSMRDIRAVRIRPDPIETMADAKVRRYIRQAREVGLEVMLFPIIHLERRRKGEWRGLLAPTNPDRWWVEYEAFLLHYAGLAADEGVAILSVGSELLSLEGETERWTAPIGKLRARCLRLELVWLRGPGGHRLHNSRKARRSHHPPLVPPHPRLPFPPFPFPFPFP